MINDTTLRHGDVTLRPLAVTDAPALRAIVDADAWAGMSSPLPATDTAMAEQLATIVATPRDLAFAVERAGRFVGRTTLYDLTPGLKAEIGNTIYARDVWGSDLNPTAKLLLFEHGFDVLGLQRIALRCDHRNVRSHRAILRLGATFEGTLRRFRPAADGTIADIDYFSVLLQEWPTVRAGLEERLAA